MSQVIEILTSLGINTTVFYQFAVFFLAYISMNYIVFKPYLKAYDERMNRTVGGQEQAEKLLAQSNEKEESYKKTARDLNTKIREVFSTWNDKAKAETDLIIGEAKKQADQDLKLAQKQLDDTVAAVRKEMDQFIPSISENIQNKIMRQ